MTLPIRNRQVPSEINGLKVIENNGDGILSFFDKQILSFTGEQGINLYT